MEKLADYWLEAKADMISMPVDSETHFGNNHYFFNLYFFTEKKGKKQIETQRN